MSVEPVSASRGVTSPRLDEALLALSVERMRILSRSMQGVSDTSVSALKAPAELQGAALATGAEANLVHTVRFLFDLLVRPPTRTEEVQALMERSALLCNQGLVAEPLRLRSWMAHPGQPAPELLPDLLTAFYEEYLSRVAEFSVAPVESAAWIEQRWDQQIHPLYDGCGRVARAHAAAILLRAGFAYPVFPSRDRYLTERGKPLEQWVEFYRARVGIENAGE